MESMDVEHVETRTRHLRPSDPDGHFADFTIIASGTVFRVHKVDLASKSSFLRNMFLHEHQRSTYEFTEHSSNIVELCLHYMYTDDLRINPHNVCDVLALLKRLNLTEAVQRCECFFQDDLNRSNCLQMRKIATQHSLSNLKTDANKAILKKPRRMAKHRNLGCLSSEEMRSLQESASDSDSFWIILQAWSRRTTHNVCRAMETAPFSSFTINAFKNAVWKHDHIYSCDNCKRIAAHQFLGNINEIPEETSPDDLMFLKNLAKTYSFLEVEDLTFRYIEEHPDSFLCDPLIEIFDTDELITCLSNMKNKCTPRIFSALVRYLRRDDGRHDMFKHIFRYAQNPNLETDLTFLSSLSAFVGMSEMPCDVNARGEPNNNNSHHYSEEDFWFPKHCLFLKELAKRYQYGRIEKLIDECITGQFELIAELPEFVNLSADDMHKYLSSRATYDYGAKPVWQALVNWVNHNHDAREIHFEDIFVSMKLDLFEKELLQNDVLLNELVVNSRTAMALILRQAIIRNT